ncbi:hypothetical protein DFJ58DRAFT_842666 [Suillus subalutaceus]|uniref:uncharacterized protein n=1 Tax=Suillus subalutaceus TaxID=48586 RepID=UPI001B865E5F|nr:uncharacterized protein DFJ58DRAFT_842666 [Suillus subalutaceus]KAG1849465.1 hypothetical protein DFJ58DRAFT_842666 [Suillus subalutaceus]
MSLCMMGRFSLLTEVNSQEKHILHHDIWGKWVALEQKLLWCQEHMGTGLLIPWGTKLRCPPTAYGYQQSHADANLAKKVAMRSQNIFLLLAATCSWYIMTHQYHGSNHPWMAILTNDLKYPIYAEWALELSHSFVGDLTQEPSFLPITALGMFNCPFLRTCIIISHLRELLPVRLSQFNGVSQMIVRGVGRMTVHGVNQTTAVRAPLDRTVVYLDGIKPVESSPYPIFLKPMRTHYFQSPNPTLDKSEEKIGRHYLLRVPTTWISYNKSTRVYNSFRNEWDLCDTLDPVSIPDGDWEEVSYGRLKPTLVVMKLCPQRNILKHLPLHPEADPPCSMIGLTRHNGLTYAKLIGDDPTNISSIPEVQKHVITCFIGYLITLSQSQLLDILPNLWDLGPDPSLLILNQVKQ